MVTQSGSKPVVESVRGRRFACFPAAVLGFIVDDHGRFLLMSRPDGDGWQVVAGALEADESPLEALIRETREEAGLDLRLQPLGVVHAFLYPYDPNVTSMLSIAYVAHYLGGKVVPGSDMAGSEVGWFDLDDIIAEGFGLSVPEQPWLFERAASMHDLLVDKEDMDLEPWANRQPWHFEIDAV